MHSQGNNTPQALKLGSFQRHSQVPPFYSIQWDFTQRQGLSSAAGFISRVKEKVFQAALAIWREFL